MHFMCEEDQEHSLQHTKARRGVSLLQLHHLFMLNKLNTTHASQAWPSRGKTQAPITAWTSCKMMPELQKQDKHKSAAASQRGHHSQPGSAVALSDQGVCREAHGQQPTQPH